MLLREERSLSVEDGECRLQRRDPFVARLVRVGARARIRVRLRVRLRVRIRVEVRVKGRCRDPLIAHLAFR